MTYSFRNRFQITNDRRLLIQSVEHEITSADSAESVLLAAGLRKKDIKECDTLILQGSDYLDFESALNAGRRWRQILIPIMARQAIGIDIGDDDDAKLVPVDFPCSTEYREQLGFKPDDKFFKDRIGLLIFETPAQFGYVQLYGVVNEAFNPQKTHDMVEAADALFNGTWSDELGLAYKLVHASLSDKNPESKFILAVTAVEALIPYRLRIPEVVTVLDSLIAHINAHAGEIDSETLDAVLHLLESDKYKPVRSFGMKLTDRLVGEYGGKTPRKYFDYAYGTRSDLAHGNLRNIPKLSIEALIEEYTELQRFVLDILEAWTPDYSYDGASSTDNETAEQ